VTSYRDPKLLIALTIIGLFAYAYVQRPNDEVLQGALIAAFSGAWGYFLGSSSGASANRDQVGKALDIAAANQPTIAPDVILKPGETAKAEGEAG
jgi:hypothetical protein